MRYQISYFSYFTFCSLHAPLKMIYLKLCKINKKMFKKYVVDEICKLRKIDILEEAIQNIDEIELCPFDKCSTLMLMDGNVPKGMEALSCEGCDKFACNLHEDEFVICDECSDYEHHSLCYTRWCNNCNELDSHLKTDGRIYGPYCDRHQGIREYRFNNTQNGNEELTFE